MNFTTIQYSVADGVVTITLNRPEARNALNRAMCEELIAAASAIAADTDLRLVLVRGAGPVFCAGADLKERPGMNVRVGNHIAPEGGPHIIHRLQRILSKANQDCDTPYSMECPQRSFCASRHRGHNTCCNRSRPAAPPGTPATAAPA